MERESYTPQLAVRPPNLSRQDLFFLSLIFFFIFVSALIFYFYSPKSKSKPDENHNDLAKILTPAQSHKKRSDPTIFPDKNSIQEEQALSIDEAVLNETQSPPPDPLSLSIGDPISPVVNNRIEERLNLKNINVQ